MAPAQKDSWLLFVFAILSFLLSLSLLISVAVSVTLALSDTHGCHGIDAYSEQKLDLHSRSSDNTCPWFVRTSRHLHKN